MTATKLERIRILQEASWLTPIEASALLRERYGVTMIYWLAAPGRERTTPAGVVSAGVETA